MKGRPGSGIDANGSWSPAFVHASRTGTGSRSSTAHTRPSRSAHESPTAAGLEGCPVWRVTSSAFALTPAATALAKASSAAT